MSMLTGYDDVQLIGEGGLGKVYRARRISTGGLVAIKELRDVEEASPAWHRARRELDALLRLKGHPYVINVEEVAQGPSGPCLVMEYAPNGSLLDRMASQPFTGPELILIGQQVCDALSAAHKLGIVHRDIKPHNLLIGSFGQVKVCDFGIAQLARDGEANTKTSAITMAYASPEEIDGDGQVGPAADVYSFGATMLHLITGKRPTFKNRMDTGTIDLSAADPALAPVSGLLRQSMAHEPEDRPSIDNLVAGFDEAAARLNTARARSLLVTHAVASATPGDSAGGTAADETVIRPTVASAVSATALAGEVLTRQPESDRKADPELTVVRQLDESPAIKLQPHPVAATRISRRRLVTISAIAAALGVFGVALAMTSDGESESAKGDDDAVAVTTISRPSPTSTTTLRTASSQPATSTTGSVAPTGPPIVTSPPRSSPSNAVSTAPTSAAPLQAVHISPGAIDYSFWPTCQTDGCRRIWVTSSGWTPGQSLTVSCTADGATVSDSPETADGGGAVAFYFFAPTPKHDSVYCEVNGVRSNTIAPWTW